MNVLLTGASGFIGRQVAATLNADGHSVTAADRSHGLNFKAMRRPADWTPLLPGIEAVINCVGIIAETRTQSFDVLHHEAPAALFRACAANGVRRVIQVSALGADEHAFTPYQLSKRAADDVLRSLPLEWFVLRPSLVYGRAGASTALFRTLAALPIVPLLGNGGQRIQPVHIDDVVAAIQTCLTARPAGRTIDVVGREPMTLVTWLQRLRQHDGKRMGPTFRIPLGLVAATARVAKYVVPTIHPDNLAMLAQGNTADVRPFEEFLGRPPRDLP